MKIATTTWYHYENYGTALQATALTEVIRRMGNEVQMIRYIPFGQPVSLLDYSLSSLAKRHFGKKAIKSKRFPEYTSVEKSDAFRRFLGEHLVFTEPCQTMADLENLNEQFDAFICGSDQIWSPLVFDPKYYLNYVHDNRKKIAYAPSLGVKKWNDPFIKREIKDLILSFGALSVREETGKQLIKELTGKDAEVVLDPTLLLSGAEWEKLCGIEQREVVPYLLVYFLGNRPEHWESAAKTAEKLGLQLRIIPVHQVDVQRDGCIQEAVGPEEFLELIKNASYVCTDSFHGMNFSLLFHVPFTAYMRFAENDPKNQNDRVEHLLSMVGMQARVYLSHTEDAIIAGPYDTDRADVCLAHRREKSLAFLETALTEARNAHPVSSHVLKQNSLCCGCGTCALACPVKAITVLRNQRGFLTAEVDESKCVHCGKCVAICPFCGKTASHFAEDAKLYSFINHDSNVLNTSTSGGAGYSIAAALIQKGYAVVGCRYSPTTHAAEHVIINDSKDLSLIQGSKYLQSSFSGALQKAKEIKSPIVFFGTPCQIAGAKRAFSDRNNVVYCDLICHGVPSQLLFTKYFSFLHRKFGICTEKPQMIFRYKPKSWRTIHLFATDGTHEYCQNQFDDPFFRAFEHGICYNEACYECRWRGNSEADIRLGDFWGPRFEENQTGVSMVVCFTEKGRQLIELLKECNADIQEQPIDDYLLFQSQTNPIKPVFYRSVLKHLQGKTRIEAIVERYVLPLENKIFSRGKHLSYLLKMLAFRD